jgi:hypothetical protein
VENNRINEQRNKEKDQHGSLKAQLTVFTGREEQYQLQLKERGARIDALEVSCSHINVLELSSPAL